MARLLLKWVLLLSALSPQSLLAASPSLDGIWRSEGYGYVFEIKDAVLKAFEITTKTCVLGFTAQRQQKAIAEREATFKSKDGVFFVRSGGSVDHKLLHQEETVPDIRIDRIESLPATCMPPTANTPVNNFEVFTQTWAEQYISFERRHVDWDAVVSQYRSKVDSDTPPQQLFDIFEAMIQPMGDLHTYVNASAIKRSTKEFWRPGSDRIIQGGMDHFADRGRWELFARIDRTNLEAPPRMFCRKGLQYGHLNETTGYLRIRSFGAYARHDDLKALQDALEVIFSDDRLQALVIDLRLSFGGSDELGLAIASRFAKSDYLAYAVQARSDPVDRYAWTPAMPIFVRPSARPGFHGPIAVLTGPITMSGAETFLEALLGRPQVIRIGENTQGVFCDVLDRHLPNGWSFGLPNAVYRTAQGQAFDVTGIPPDIQVPVFDDTDVAAGRDPAIEAAKRVLSIRTGDAIGRKSM